MHNCIKCGSELFNDDMGATKKLINRGTTEYMCIPCLAKKFGVTEARLHEKIDEWRAMGCTLFSPQSRFVSDRNTPISVDSEVCAPTQRSNT